MGVFGLVLLFCWVYIGVHFCTYSEDVEVSEVDNVEFCHDRFRMCARWEVFGDSEDFLLCSDERLHVCCVVSFRSPY